MNLHSLPYIDMHFGPYQAQGEAKEWMGRGMGDPPLPTSPPEGMATEKAAGAADAKGARKARSSASLSSIPFAQHG
jgi:hypothetical protein